MSQNTTWEINGKSFELDVFEEETAQKYTDAFKTLADEEKNIKYTGNLVEQVRSYCQVFYNLFDNIFGEGAGIEILGEKRSVTVCNETYDSFLNFVSEQKKAVANFGTEVTAKYSNRQTRRAAAKKKSGNSKK